MVVFNEQNSNCLFFIKNIQMSSNFSIISNFLVKLKPQNTTTLAFWLNVSPTSKYHIFYILIFLLFTRSLHHWKSPLLAIGFVVFKPFIKIIKTYPIFRLSNFFSFTFSSLSNLISSNSSIFYSKLAYYNSSDSCSSFTSSICSRLSITIINLFFKEKFIRIQYNYYKVTYTKYY